MKKDIHPQDYRPVIFHDTTSGQRFLISSTIQTSATDTWTDGKTYPMVRIEVSSTSHPVYTGLQVVVDTAGRVERFKTRAGKAKKQ